MTKALWTFVRNDGNGTPMLPAGHGGRYTNPCDIVRISGGPAGNEHTHLLLGGYGLPDDNLIGGAGEGHVHFVVDTGADLAQVTRGTVDHEHDLPTDANGNLAPEWFLLFWTGPDAGAAAIEASGDCFPVVEAQVDEETGQIGELDNTAWTGQEQTQWQARSLSVLGFQLPAEVDRGKRLVMLFAGALLARPGSERGLRFTS